MAHKNNTRMLGLEPCNATAAPSSLEIVRMSSPRGKADMLEPMAKKLDRLERSRLVPILEEAGVTNARDVADVIRRYVLSDTRVSGIYDETTPEGLRYADYHRAFG